MEIKYIIIGRAGEWITEEALTFFFLMFRVLEGELIGYQHFH